MSEIRLDASGEQALHEAERLCTQMNLAIQGPEHLLSGALLVLAGSGALAITAEQVEGAIAAVHGYGEGAHKDRVMLGPGLRAALSLTAGAVGRAGGTVINATLIARGAIASGEVNPAFYGALGITKDDLAALLDTPSGNA